ncbi:MAG: DUF29 domain-containing protein [Leptolyngbya sp. SIO1D8]|nr:DUF29 domain-containing protein [Leptolyngbya sp. SIO1D8]
MMIVPLPINSSSRNATLYKQNYFRWLVETAQLLRQGDLDTIDFTSLVEELEDIKY